MYNTVPIEDIFKEGGVLSEHNPNYVLRPKQLEGAQIIENSLENNEHTIIEGECGFGKSYAYLFPVLNYIVKNEFNYRAVIVTSGISLQEQLLRKDLPFVCDIMKDLYPAMPGNFKFCMLKGRQNFICLKKIKEIGLDSKQDSLIIDTEYKKIKEFVQKTKTGDLSELDHVPNQDVMSHICCLNRTDCTTKKCECANDCYYLKHKSQVDNSHIIITNYHMLFSDIAIGNKILPKYDILVFDEAHEAAEIYRNMGEITFSVNTMINLRNKVSELTNLTDEYECYLKSDEFTGLKTMFEILMQDIESKYHGRLGSPLILHDITWIPDSYKQFSNYAKDLYNKVLDTIDRRSQQYDIDYEDETEVKISNVILEIENIIENICLIFGSLNSILEDKNNVFWAEYTNTLTLNLKKIDVSDSLAQQVYNKENLRCIFTSATMSVGGTFDYIKHQLGIDKVDKKVNEFLGGSPFNLTEQQLWYLPSDSLDGNDRNFDETIGPHLLDIIDATHGGVLVLFTSIRNMENSFNYLFRELNNEYTLFKQGSMPRSKLIEAFKNDGNSVLLATKSFFTGIDIPGKSLRAVVIDKLPFQQTKDPVQQILMTHDNAFFKYSIPEMIIALRQAVGRGVRSIDDKCVIAILDGRMCTARYKKKINNSFPYEKTGTRNIQDVQDFISNWLK